MELTVQPTNLVLAHNQVPVEVTVASVVTNGVNASSYVHFASIPIIGTELLFEFGERSVLLVVKSVVDAGSDPYGSIPATATASVIADVLKNHPVLSAFFEITYNTTNSHIEFLARNTGSEYSLTPLAAGSDNVGNADTNYNYRSLVTMALGTDDAVAQTEVELELLAEDVMASGNYKPVVLLGGIADKLDKVQWDLQGNLAALFTSSFLPELSSAAARVIYDLSWRFRLFVNGVGSFSNQPSYYVALNTGVTKEDFAKFTDFESEVLGNKFLSWRNTNRSITRESPEWLYFLQNVDRWDYSLQGGTGFDEIELNVKIYYADETTETMKPFLDTTCQKYGVLEFPVGYDALGLAAKEAVKPILYYQCWLVLNRDEDNQDPTIYEDISEVITYVLEDETFLDTHFVFRNSFNVFETIRAEGIKKNEFTTIKKAISKVLEAGYSTEDGESEYYSSIFSESYEVTIAASSKQEFEWFKDFLLSKDAFLVVGDHLVKIKVLPGKFKMAEDDNYEWVLTFSYQFANVNSKLSWV